MDLVRTQQLFNVSCVADARCCLVFSPERQGAVIGAILFEGWARTHKEAEQLAASGDITFAPNHHYNAVGPMAGITRFA